MSRKGENIYKRKDGRWEGRYKNGYTGKYMSVYGHTYKEVKNKLTSLKASSCSYDNRQSFQKISEEWLKHAQLNIKQSSYENYLFLLQKHILPYFGSMKMTELTKHTITKFIDMKLTGGKLKQKTGLSVKYLRDIIAVVKAIATFCEQEYDIPSRIRYIRLPAQKKDARELPGKIDVKRLSWHIKSDLSLNGLGILLSLNMGLRLGEVCGLKWSDIEVEAGTLTVNRSVSRISTHSGHTRLIVGTPKTASSQRSIPIPANILKLLKANKSADEHYIISASFQPPEPARLRKFFKQTLKNNGIKEFRYHDLRHIFASRCVARHFDIKALSEILGHSNTAMTLNRYVHSDMETKRKYMDMIAI